MEHNSTSPSILTSLTSYVPVYLLSQLTEDMSLHEIPTEKHEQAALLFADISGFTKLTERLAQQGPVGAEILSQLLSRYLGQLVDHILANGGDILKFAGDALLASWFVSDSELSLAVQQAAQCALVIQTALNASQTGSDNRLSLRISIGSGEISVLHIGGILQRISG